MARITFTLPELLYQQLLKQARNDKDSLSYTVTKLVEIGLMVINAKNNKQEEKSNALEEYCQKLIIQMNGIIKKIALDNYHFEPEKITEITQETLNKFNQLKNNKFD